MTEAKSFRQMIDGGELKRADAMKARLDTIHEEPGFNARLNTDGEEFKAGIRQFAEYIAAGGVYPPLEVRPRPDGGVWIVEGHRRRLALLMARDEMGAPVEFVPIVAFVGNDADRLARVVTSASQVHLSPLEYSLQLKKLAALGLTPDEISAKVHKTRQYVEQLLILANANTDVQKMVAGGDVSASIASQLARQHGEDAGQVLQKEKEKAKAKGKTKITAGTMKQWTPPPKIVTPLVSSIATLLDGLSAGEHEALAGIRNNTSATDTVMVSGAALLAVLDSHQALIDARKAKESKVRDKVAKAKQKTID